MAAVMERESVDVDALFTAELQRLSKIEGLNDGELVAKAARLLGKSDPLGHYFTDGDSVQNFVHAAACLMCQDKRLAAS